jgi:hypothetical protein
MTAEERIDKILEHNMLLRNEPKINEIAEEWQKDLDIVAEFQKQGNANWRYLEEILSMLSNYFPPDEQLSLNSLIMFFDSEIDKLKESLLITKGKKENK